MDETLKRLLEAEAQAEKIASDAEQERERIIQEALLEARAEEARFEAGIPELQARLLAEAEARAEQAIGERKRRYRQQHLQLRDLAERREGEALEAALSLLLDPAVDD